MVICSQPCVRHSRGAYLKTWLNDINKEDFKLNEYDYINSNRSYKKGGGVGIYVTKQTQYKIRKDLNPNVGDTIETIFIEIEKTVGKNIIVGVIYRPPNGRIEIFENAMNEILAKIDKENKICYLMGDFNIDLLKSESCDYTNRFTEQLFTSSFIPLITKPTRITHHTATLIDNIFTNNIEKLESSTNGIIFSDLSDHLPIVHMCNLNTHKENSNSSDPIYKRVINNSNIKLFTNTIKNIPWEDVLNNTNPTETFDKFSKIYTTAYETHFPIKCTETK